MVRSSLAAPAGRGTLLSAADLRYAYREAVVLDGIELALAGGEVVGLLGANGSGKTTLIKVLSGILPRYEGAIELEGRELRSLTRRQLARTVAVVSQEPAFSFPYTALEIVLMGRQPYLGPFSFESPEDLRLAREALARCAASHLAERTIGELSSGERQRVVFARALAQMPRLLLLDEPASHLDVRHQVELYGLVRDLARREGKSILVVLHDLNLAAEYCDRVYMLRQGRVAYTGSPSEVFTSENLTRVFDTDLHVTASTLTGALMVVPLPRGGRGQPRGSSR
jgi:iron complex transport system ATP-binding protein